MHKIVVTADGKRPTRAMRYSHYNTLRRTGYWSLPVLLAAATTVRGIPAFSLLVRARPYLATLVKMIRKTLLQRHPILWSMVRVFLLFFAALTISIISVGAQEFRRLPDGRYVINIFGQEMAFRAEDSEQVYLPTNNLPAPARQGVPTSFRDYLNYPALAHVALAAEDHFVRVWISAWPKDDKLFLGIFDKKTIPPLKPPHVLKIVVHREPDPYGNPRETGQPEARRGFVGYDAQGFAVIDPTLYGDRSDPSRRGYILAGAKRVTASQVNLAVWCGDAIGRSDRQCSTTVRTQDRRIAASWTWFEDDFPQANWRDLDERLRQIVNHVLVNKPSGELE